MTTISKRINRVVLILATLLVAQPLQSSSAQSSSDTDDEHKAHSLQVLNYVTGWSLDSEGYHPAVYMLLENISGKDLSGVPIKMQGKFTDVHTLEPSTAKTEFRRALKSHQQFPIALIAPRNYELPKDVNVWPVMECKAMMRVGSVGDEGTEYLLVTKVDATTATQDEAFQKLNEQTSYNRSNPSAGRHEKEHEGHGRESRSGGSEPSHTKPLIAKAEHLKGTAPHAVADPSAASGGNSSAASGSSSLFSLKQLPGLGDDFYAFEKSFGLPLETDAKKKDFTWAKYRHAGSGVELVVGSRERSGKADLIAFVIPRSCVKSDQALVDQCKPFCASLHPSKLSAPAKSVRYLPSGRVEMLSSMAPGLRILSLAVPDSGQRPASYLVMISRLNQAPDELLRSHQATSEILKNLPLGD